MLIGCCGITEDYRVIRRMGYDFVELSGRQIMSLSEEAFGAFLREYKDAGFPCRAFNDYCGAAAPMIGPGYNRAAAKAYAEKLCERGRQLGVRTIGIGAPAARLVPAGYSMERADADMADFLKTVCAAAAECEIVILLEAVNKYRCNYINRTAEACSLVRALRLPNLAMVYDVYHSKIMGESAGDLREALPYIKHLHVSTDLERGRRGFLKEEDMPAFEGLLKMVTDAGYTGNVSVEASGEYLRSHGDDCANYMRRSLAGILDGKHSTAGA